MWSWCESSSVIFRQFAGTLIWISLIQSQAYLKEGSKLIPDSKYMSQKEVMSLNFWMPSDSISQFTCSFATLDLGGLASLRYHWLLEGYVRNYCSLDKGIESALIYVVLSNSAVCPHNLLYMQLIHAPAARMWADISWRPLPAPESYWQSLQPADASRWRVSFTLVHTFYLESDLGLFACHLRHSALQHSYACNVKEIHCVLPTVETAYSAAWSFMTKMHSELTN